MKQANMKKYRTQTIDEKIHAAGFVPLDILLVGATGVGKSSTLNALFGEDIAAVGEGVDPETMQIEHYKVNDVLRIWDSPGLGDGLVEDERHEAIIKDSLCKNYTHDDAEWGFIDLVIVILDGSSKDMGTTYHLLEEVILHNIAHERVIIAINKADMAMSGRSWNKSTNQPQEKLSKFLKDKAISVADRLSASTFFEIENPVYYSAEKKYNLDCLMDCIIDHIPTQRRIPDQDFLAHWSKQMNRAGFDV